MNDLGMAAALMGAPRSNPGQTTTVYGVASSDSQNGLVLIDLGGDTVSPDDDQSIECETTFKVYEGDEVIVSLIGADGSGKTPIVVGIVGRGDQQQEQIDAVVEQTEDLWETSTDLRSQIIQSANNLRIDIEANAGSINELNGQVTNIMNTYVTSDYIEGQFTSSLRQTITNEVNNIVEHYDYSEIVSGIVGGDIETLKSFATLINGEIRRGMIYDPELGVDVLGIAISQSIQFYENDPLNPPAVVDGNTYYRIMSNQTFGFYTSYGWQFYVNGQKVGWFDSMDSKAALHVASEVVEDGIQFGSSWEVSQSSSGIGFRYIGS